MERRPEWSIHPSTGGTAATAASIRSVRWSKRTNAAAWRSNGGTLIDGVHRFSVNELELISIKRFWKITSTLLAGWPDWWSIRLLKSALFRKKRILDGWHNGRGNLIPSLAVSSRKEIYMVLVWFMCGSAACRTAIYYEAYIYKLLNWCTFVFVLNCV